MRKNTDWKEFIPQETKDECTDSLKLNLKDVEEILDGEKIGLHYKDPEGIQPQAISYQELIAPLVTIIADLLDRVKILEKIISVQHKENGSN